MRVQTTRIYAEIENAYKGGYSVVSEQGSSRSSKTYNTTIWIIVHCLQFAGTTCSVCRATLPALKSSVLRDFIEILQNMGVYDPKDFNKSELIYHFKNGSWVEFFSCDNEQKLRGRKRAILYVNEANEIKYIDWTQLQLRTTEFSIVDYNPSFSDENWLCDVNKDPRTKHFITTYRDNPFLEQKVIDEIESLQWKNKSLWQIYGLGLQAIVEGLVFPKYELIDEFPEHCKKVGIGMDLGYTNDPTAIVKCGYDGVALFLDELCYRTEMLTSDIIRELRKVQQYKVISESADPRLVQEVYRGGINIHPVVKFSGSIEAGITKMQELKIYITKRSVNLIKEAKNYTYQQDKDGKWLNKPIDAYNHCFTADTLVETNEGQKRIVDVKVGDLVATSEGYKKVTKTFNNGCKKVLRIKLIFSNLVVELKATPDHKIKTKNGWKELQQLQPQDTLYLFKYLKERNTDCILEKNTTAEVQRGCITVKFQTDITFTTRMRIQPTTLSKILNLSRGASTCASTHKNICKTKTHLKKCVNVWTTQEYLLTSGIANSAKEFLETLSQSKSNVIAVAMSLKQKPSISVSVQTSVKPSGDETTDLTQRNESAKAVAMSLRSLPNTKKRTSVVANANDSICHESKLERIEIVSEYEDDVYDIEVEEAHEFFANGVLVHNCWDAIRYYCMMEIMGGVPRNVDRSKLTKLVW